MGVGIDAGIVVVVVVAVVVVVGLRVVVLVVVLVVVAVVVVLHCKRRTESECLTREAEHCVAMPRLFCDSCTVFSAPLDD